MTDNTYDDRSYMANTAKGKKRERTIWQCSRDCKVHYPKKTIALFISLCAVFISTLAISIILITRFDPRSAVSITCCFVTTFSIVALAVTAGNVVEVENLFDNCYEGYDDMVEYLDEHFEHDDEEAREDKSSQIRKLLYIGLVIIIISSVLIVVDNLKENSMITTVASFGILVGIGFIAGYLNEKFKR